MLLDIIMRFDVSILITLVIIFSILFTFCLISIIFFLLDYIILSFICLFLYILFLLCITFFFYYFYAEYFEIVQQCSIQTINLGIHTLEQVCRARFLISFTWLTYLFALLALMLVFLFILRSRYKSQTVKKYILFLCLFIVCLFIIFFFFKCNYVIQAYKLLRFLSGI